MEVVAKALADVATDVAADIAAGIISRMELEIQQLEELKVFNSLRLPIEDTTEVIVEVV